jgi:hypothetical protein
LLDKTTYERRKARRERREKRSGGDAKRCHKLFAGRDIRSRRETSDSHKKERRGNFFSLDAGADAAPE